MKKIKIFKDKFNQKSATHTLKTTKHCQKKLKI